ncbi:hypothetical protein U3516DRAFT_643204 [Neocallimastix sp. 'constans']
MLEGSTMDGKNKKMPSYYDSSHEVYSSPYLLSKKEYYHHDHNHNQDFDNDYDYDYNNDHEHDHDQEKPYYYDFTFSKKNRENLDHVMDHGSYRFSKHTRSASFSSSSSTASFSPSSPFNNNGSHHDHSIKIRSKSVDPRPRPKSFFLGGGYYHQADSFHRSRSMDEHYLDDPRVALNYSSSSSSSSNDSSSDSSDSSNTSSSSIHDHNSFNNNKTNGKIPYYHLPKSKKENKYKPLPDVVVSPRDDPHRVFRPPETIHDPKLKYLDYQKKQKILGAMQALSNGKLPTNEQLFIFLNHLRKSRQLQEYSVHLSAEGKFLFQDWMEFLDIAYLMLQEKNKDENLQKFIYYSRLSSQTSLSKNIYHPILDFIKRKKNTKRHQTKQNEIKQAYTEAFGIIQLFLSNNQFRSLIGDINQLIKEMSIELFNQTVTNPNEKINYDSYKTKKNPLEKEINERNDPLKEKLDSNHLKKHPFYREVIESNETKNLNNNPESSLLHDEQNHRNNNTNSTSSSSFQNISIHEGDNRIATGDKLTASNNPNPYQDNDQEEDDDDDDYWNIRKNSDEFLNDNKEFLMDPLSDEKQNDRHLYSNKYRSKKYQYQIKRPLSSSIPYSKKGLTFLRRSNSLDDSHRQSLGRNGNRRGKKDAFAFKHLSNSIHKINRRSSNGSNLLFEGENTSKSMKNQISQKIPKEKLQAVNHTLKSKFNKNVIYNILKRLQRIISEIQRDDRYQNAISVLIKISNDFIKNSLFLMKKTKRSVSSSKEDTNTTESLKALKSIIENLAQGYSLNKLLHSLGNIKEYIKNDKYKKEYIRKINRYLYKVLKDPQFIQSQAYIDTGMELLDEGYLTFSEKYAHQEYFQNELETVFIESSNYLDHLITDPLTRRFSDSLMQLTKDMFINRNGKMTFKKELFKDIVTISLPIIVQNIKYIPISRLEYEDANYHFVMEDIFLSSDNFLPNIMEAKLKNTSIIGLRKSINSDIRNYITLNFYEIQADIRDVPFWYHKKKGFPKMTDWGVVNFTIGGRGITIMTKFELCKNDPYRILVPRKIDCFVDDLNLEIKRSKYGILYSLGSSMINNKIRRQLILNIRKRIFDAVDNVNESLLNLRNNYKDDINFSWVKMLTL